MKKIIPVLLLVSQFSFAQTTAQKLEKAVESLMATAPAYASNISIYVADERGNFVYENGGNKGLSTASTQKIFTAAAALDVLGKDYTYTTTSAFSGTLSGGTLTGDLWITSNGDPTLGSWRYEEYKPDDFKQKLITAIKSKGIKQINGNLMVDDGQFDFQTVPGGWPWNDMGNYYGAGVWGVNWRENQFDLMMSNATIKSQNVELPGVVWVNDLEAGGTSDQSLIYTAPHSEVAYINGKLPAKAMTISGAMPNPPLTLGSEIQSWLKSAGIQFNGKIVSTSQMRIKGEKIPTYPQANQFFEYKSPSMDKIVYWFLRKSINLYGETIIKTLAKEKRGVGSFSVGVDFLRDYWASKGINTAMINFADGSGLSPQNYVSARAQVQALLWAKKQPWFSVFYEGFPTQANGMKMKSGTMKDTKSFAGYHNGYVFSIIINNYQGAAVSDALFKTLNPLK